MTAPTCPYCGKAARLGGSFYGRKWECPPCGARVGCHKDTITPLGTLANAELRLARQAAHEWFDPLWKQDGMSRRGAYALLADLMGLHVNDTHIAMFTVKQCQQVVQVMSWLRREMRDAA